MKRNIKKTFFMLLVAITVLAAMPLLELTGFNPFTTKAQAATESGKCGDNAFWTLDTETGVLTISGSGSIRDYEVDGPWEDEKNLKTVVIQDGITAIGNYAFWGCADITSVSIPESVTSIGKRSFYNCTALSEISLSENTATIGEEAFSGCRNITSIIIPDSVSYLGDSAFRYCPSLTDLKIGSSITEIRPYTFVNCGLTELVIPDNIEKIGYDAFFDCASLKNLVLGNGVTVIGTGAFANCSSLEEVIIPDNVKDLGTFYSGNAFANCTGLKKVTIGKGLEDLSYDTFNNCTSLETVIYNAENCEIYLNGRTNGAFDTCTSIATVIIGSDVDQIPQNCFNSCTVKKLTISDGSSVIGKSAFENCLNLEEVIFEGNSMRVIGTWAFADCDSLKSFIIPNGVINVEDFAFGYCDNLEFVHIPKSVTNLGCPYAVQNKKTYLCCDTEECSAKELADEKELTFKICDGHGLTDTNDLILTPSTTNIKYGETLILHINQGEMPDNANIVWTVDGGAVTIKPSEDGNSCAVTSTGAGTVNVTATAIDKDGNTTSASVEITSKSNLWLRIVSFILNMLNLNRTIWQ